MAIPTIDFELPVSKRNIKIKQWLTQTQEDEHLKLSVGDNPIQITGNNENAEQTYTVSVSNIAVARKYLVTSLVEDIKYEEFDELAPQDREAIINKCEEIKDKKKA